MEYKEINEQCLKGVEVFEKAKKLIDNGNNDSVYQSLASQLREYQNRFAEQKLTVLIAGEVSTGKSTFINSLLGTDILSTATEACTNVPSKIVYGDEEKILVHFSADDKGGTIKEPLIISREEVSDYSTETLNKENQKKVEYIEIQTKSPLLAEGLAFIDTPGLGAIDPLHAIATYRIATKADIVFFLGDVRKPLTDSEISSLKDLIKVSKSEKIVHLLTCCDLKDPEGILSSNKRMFDKEFNDLNIQIIKISSLLYRKYVKTGIRTQLDGSGFQKVRTYIADINADLKTILNKRYSELVYSVCQSGHKLLSEVIEVIENPETKEKRVAELQSMLDRLQEIEDNQAIWSQQLVEKQRLFYTDLNVYIADKKKTIIGNVSKRLEEDSYLDDKDKLGKSISADLISFQNDLERKIPEGFENIYDWLRRETGLKEIQDQSTQPPDYVSTDIKIDEELGDIKFGEKIRDVYIASATGFAIGAAGSWAGAAAGAKIGAAIGTAIAPAIGTAIGATVGAVAGVLSGIAIFQGSKESRKKKQRAEILAECTKQINDFFAEVTGAIEKANIPNSTALTTRFITELRKEKTGTKRRHSTLNSQTLRIRTHYNSIKQLVDACGSVCNNLHNNEA